MRVGRGAGLEIEAPEQTKKGRVTDGVRGDRSGGREEPSNCLAAFADCSDCRAPGG